MIFLSHFYNFFDFFGFFFLATKQTDQCSQVTGINLKEFVIISDLIVYLKL